MHKKKVRKPSHPKYSRLVGLMAEYGITVAQMAKAIGRAPSTISKTNNGWTLYDSMDMKNIQKSINLKAEAKAKSNKEQPKYYSIDEIFYS